MVRQRKDGDSLERLDGSKPIWKVCLDVWLILSAWPACVGVYDGTNSIILIAPQSFIGLHNRPKDAIINVYLLHRFRCDGSVNAQKTFNATFNVTFAENSNLSLRALCDGG